ncbi:MAG: beta-aspartyl-peptidase [Thermodesulfobacteriota bacterium]|jgi:beta-aspartyl-dipeptidase (metallo-type)
MVTLIQGGHLYGPEDLGHQDLLAVNGKIERIATGIKGAKEIFPEMEVVNASGKLIFPGFIDQHVHIIGGGGSGGPLTRAKEVYFRDLVKAGTTTLVGTLGTDTISRSLSTLLIKAKALNQCGLNVFIYTGSVLFPPVTLTGSVEKDIVLIAEVIGVKMGLGEPVYPRPDQRELENLITETRRAGSLSRKQAVVHIHLAGSSNEWLDAIESILEAREVPYQQVVVTHVNKTPRLLERSFEYAKKGGGIDLTTCIGPPERPTSVKSSLGLKRYLEAGCPLENITFSSDSNATRVLDNGIVDYTRVGTLLEEFRDCVKKEGIPLPQALAVVTRNAALRLGIAHERGRLLKGSFADLAFFTEGLELTDLMAGGSWLFRDGIVARLDPLE